MVHHPIATLLIVDDEAAQLTALCHTLGQEGYATVGAASASAALARLREQTCLFFFFCAISSFTAFGRSASLWSPEYLLLEGGILMKRF